MNRRILVILVFIQRTLKPPFDRDFPSRRNHPQDWIGWRSFGIVAIAVRQIDEKAGLQFRMLIHILEHWTEVSAAKAFRLPFVICRSLCATIELLHLLDFCIALDDGQLVGTEGVQEAVQFREEASKEAPRTAAGIDGDHCVEAAVAGALQV